MASKAPIIGHGSNLSHPRRRHGLRRRTSSPPSLDAMLSAIPSLPRAALARLVQKAIDRMDDIDGDPDLEEDDPAGGDVCDELHDVREHYQPRPLYGVDQSKGALNGPLVARRHEIHELIADHSREGSPFSLEMIRQLRRQLGRIDAQEAAIISRTASPA